MEPLIDDLDKSPIVVASFKLHPFVITYLTTAFYNNHSDLKSFINGYGITGDDFSTRSLKFLGIIEKKSVCGLLLLTKRGTFIAKTLMASPKMCFQEALDLAVLHCNE